MARRPCTSESYQNRRASSAGPAGYMMEIAEAGACVRVRVTATPQACADCLVPEKLMRGILGQALGVPQDAIDLTHPSTSETYPSPPLEER